MSLSRSISPTVRRGRIQKQTFAFAALALLLSGSVWAPSAVKAQDMGENRRIAVAQRLQESSVSIRVGRSGGSGFVIGSERWIITNAHVVEGYQRTPITVMFGDQHQTRAEVIAFDPTQDLAILRTQPAPAVPPLVLGDSDRVQVGQNVLAFGAPFGLAGTLTQGIVSARRDFPRGDGSVLRDLIQTDAPINPGNSGGPLVNSQGQVIAVNTAILSRTGGSNGIGFAVPANRVRDLISQLQQRIASNESLPLINRAQPAQRRATVHVREAPRLAVWLGILGDDFRAPGIAGVRIHRVIPGGPAAGARLLGSEDQAPALVRQLGVRWTGHIILALDGRPVRSMNDLTRLLRNKRPGEQATLYVTVGPGAVNGEAIVRLVAPPARTP